MRKILEQLRVSTPLSIYVSFRAFSKYLQDQRLIEQVELHFPSRKETRYIRPGASVYDVALSLRPNSYLSHQSAMTIHKLTSPSLKDVYVNQEQSVKPAPTSEITQERIDLAFKNHARVTSNKAQYGDTTLRILNGKQTRQLGVITLPSPNGESLRVTGLERTLLDATVRPAYSGGTTSVINAYLAAKDRISIDILSTMLRQLNYAYPYHQAVGFYLERAGIIDQRTLNTLKDFGLKYDFYLAHGMQETRYSKNWRIHYPADLK